MAGIISFSSSSSHLFFLNHLLLRSSPTSRSPSLLSSIISFRKTSLSLTPTRLHAPILPFTSLSTLQPETRPEPEEGFRERASVVETEEEKAKQLGKRVLSELRKLPSLSVKEKKEIASYAHSLGKKLKSQQVGKSGVTDSVGVALVETLEANELLKIKIHNNCPDELDDAVKRLEELTGSVVVGQIGRTVILYRPSMTKLKAEEKKKESQRVNWRRQQSSRPSSENRGLAPRSNGHGRRGSSRYSNPS